VIPVEGDYKVTWSGPNRTGIPIAWAGMFLPINGVVIEPDALGHVLTLEDGRKGIILVLGRSPMGSIYFRGNGGSPSRDNTAS
jgi:hypothetical protein